MGVGVGGAELISNAYKSKALKREQNSLVTPFYKLQDRYLQSENISKARATQGLDPASFAFEKEIIPCGRRRRLSRRPRGLHAAPQTSPYRYGHGFCADPAPGSWPQKHAGRHSQPRDANAGP